MIIHTMFDLGDEVRIDGGDVTGVVTQICLAGGNETLNYEVTWFHNGVMYSAWIREWRLRGAP